MEERCNFHDELPVCVSLRLSGVLYGNGFREGTGQVPGIGHETFQQPLCLLSNQMNLSLFFVLDKQANC